jgi:hypothetical protein
MIFMSVLISGDLACSLHDFSNEIHPDSNHKKIIKNCMNGILMIANSPVLPYIVLTTIDCVSPFRSNGTVFWDIRHVLR